MQDEQEEKIPSDKYVPRLTLAFSLAFLLITVGIISFFYSDGLQTAKNSWLRLITPSLSLELVPESTIIPADGSSQIYVDIIVKNKKGQLIVGSEITTTIIQGEVDIINTPNTPTDISKRILVRSPYQPQTIILAFNFKGIDQRLTLEAFDPTPPATPTLKAPTDGIILSTATPIISGEAPIGVEIEIYVDDIFNTIAKTDKTGIFNTSLKQALSRGQHKIVIITLNQYDIRSAASNPIYIDIQTPDPEIDLANIRLQPNPVIAGEVFYIFIPTSANTKLVTILLENTDHQLKDRYNSSIFSGALRAPQIPGLYRLSAIIINDDNNSILASNIISLRVQ